MFANINPINEPSASSAWTLKKRPLEARDLPYLVSLDHEVYPTLENMSNGPKASNEALFRRLFFETDLTDAQGKRHRVSTHAPELSFVLECVPVSPGSPGAFHAPLPRHSIAAMCIILPLNRQGFYKLTHNLCFEYEMDPVHDLFRAERRELGEGSSETATGDKELGLHVFLIDKFVTQGVGSLYKLSLEHLAEQVTKMRQQSAVHACCPDLSVVGLSGYTVSYEGVSLFFNKLNCVERPKCFMSQEHVFTKDIKTAEGTRKTAKMVCHVRDDQHLRELCLRDNWSYGNRCKMLVTYPGEVSIVWLTIAAKPECLQKDGFVQQDDNTLVPQAASPISMHSPATLVELMRQSMNMQQEECCPHCGYMLPLPAPGLFAAGAPVAAAASAVDASLSVPSISTTTTAAAPTNVVATPTAIVVK